MGLRVDFPVLFLSFMLLSGCGDDEEATPDAGGDSEAEVESDAGEPMDYCADPVATTDTDGNVAVIAEDALNYSFSSRLEVETVPVKSLSDIRFDWSGITEDMLGHPFDPEKSVDMMELTMWRYDKDELLQDINDDSLKTGLIESMGIIYTDQMLSEGNFLDLVPPSGGEVSDERMLEYVDTSLYSPEDYTYLAMVAAGNTFGQGTKMISFFEPDPNVSNTEVVMHNDSTILHYEADLSSLKRIAVPPGEGNIVLDWQDNDILQQNAMGGTWIPTKITDVLVAHYADKTPGELEDEFLDLELIADEMWSVFLSAGQRVNLSRLKDEAGNNFAGIDDTGTWIVALKCGSCANPAPWFLSILHACPE